MGAKTYCWHVFFIVVIISTPLLARRSPNVSVEHFVMIKEMVRLSGFSIAINNYPLLECGGVGSCFMCASCCLVESFGL